MTHASMTTRIQQFIPHWITHYPKQHLSSDLVAGIVTSVLVLPQNLAYALLAGLPPQAGLLASILPVIAYALWGSSMTQAVGPVAVTAIVTYSVLSPLAAPLSAQYVALAASLALFSGVLVWLFGMCKLGFLSDLLSRPVVSGFISGAAVLILISQLKVLFGLDVHGKDVWELLIATAQSLSQSNATTALIGVASFSVLLFSKYYLGDMLQRVGWRKPRADFAVRLAPLVVVLCATVVVMRFGLDTRYGVAVVGAIGQGLSGLVFFVPDLGQVGMLALPALSVAFIGTVQNIGMAQALAVKRRERIDANQELVGLGSSNIVAAFCGGMPVGGGISRTAVNVAAGAQTPLASVVAALSMLAILIVGTAGFTRMPLAVLAASIMVAALSMVDLRALRRAWRYDRADGGALLGTALGVIVVGLQWGIALGIGLSLASLLYRASTPHIALMGRIVDTEHFRNVARHGVETIPGVLFFRVDESFFFGNLRSIETRLSAVLKNDPSVRDVVLVMSAVNRVDMTAMEALSEIFEDLRESGIHLHLAEVKGPVQDRMVHTPLWKGLFGRIHLSCNDAFEALQSKADQRVLLR
jgi:SulP family sulfate permease